MRGALMSPSRIGMHSSQRFAQSCCASRPGWSRPRRTPPPAVPAARPPRAPRPHRGPTADGHTTADLYRGFGRPPGELPGRGAQPPSCRPPRATRRSPRPTVTAPATVVDTRTWTTGGGNTFPGAEAPFGMVQWSPDTVPNRNAGGGYSFGDTCDHRLLADPHQRSRLRRRRRRADPAGDRGAAQRQSQQPSPRSSQHRRDRPGRVLLGADQPA